MIMCLGGLRQMGAKYYPNLSYLFSLDIAEEKIEVESLMIDVLRSWGYICHRYGSAHLGYSSANIFMTKYTDFGYIKLSDDEINAVDQAMVQLKEDLPDYFELLSMRYIYFKRINTIGKVIDRSRKVVEKRLGLAWRLVYNALAQILGYEQRHTISMKIFGEEIATKFSR